MFKNKPNLPEGQVDTLIGPQVVIHGDLQFSGGLLIEGRVVGRVLAEDGQPAVLTVAERGIVEGEVHAPVVVINGRMDGDVHASERVELAARARVHGDVHYQVVEMAAGATLTGRLVHADVDAVETHAAATGEAGTARAAAGWRKAEDRVDAEPAMG